MPRFVFALSDGTVAYIRPENKERNVRGSANELLIETWKNKNIQDLARNLLKIYPFKTTKKDHDKETLEKINKIGEELRRSMISALPSGLKNENKPKGLKDIPALSDRIELAHFHTLIEWTLDNAIFYSIVTPALDERRCGEPYIEVKGGELIGRRDPRYPRNEKGEPVNPDIAASMLKGRIVFPTNESGLALSPEEGIRRHALQPFAFNLHAGEVQAIPSTRRDMIPIREVLQEALSKITDQDKKTRKLYGNRVDFKGLSKANPEKIYQTYIQQKSSPQDMKDAVEYLDDIGYLLYIQNKSKYGNLYDTFSRNGVEVIKIPNGFVVKRIQVEQLLQRFGLTLSPDMYNESAYKCPFFMYGKSTTMKISGEWEPQKVTQKIENFDNEIMKNLDNVDTLQGIYKEIVNFNTSGKQNLLDYRSVYETKDFDTWTVRIDQMKELINQRILELRKVRKITRTLERKK